METDAPLSSRPSQASAAPNAASSKPVELGKDLDHTTPGGEKRKRPAQDYGRGSDARSSDFDRRDRKNKWPKSKKKKDYNPDVDGRRARLDASREKAAERSDRSVAIHATEFSKEEIEAEERRPKKKVAVLIGYAGTGYYGMQFNHNAKTIEGDLFQAFVKAGAISKANANDPKKSSFVRCARTDKGVHAAGNVISLKLTVEDPDVVSKINEHLVPQIRVWGYEPTIKSFSAYHMVDSRVYEYLIPTYCFLPPHPRSFLAKKLSEHAAEMKDTEAWQQRQQEVAGFWDDAYERYIKPALEQIEPELRGPAWEQLFEQEEEINEDEDAEKEEGEEGEYRLREIDTGIDAKMEARVEIPAETQTGVEASKDPPAAAPSQVLKGPKVLTPLEEAQKKIKAAMLTAKKAWRIGPERLARIKSTLSRYEGTRNYHNYTIRVGPKDPSAKRTIKSFVVNGDPFVINDVEWLSLKVHGQSFMMHQIRKMVGLATLVVRCGTHEGRMQDTMEQDRISIPRSPGLGLLLERPIYDSYNLKLGSQGNSGKNGVSFSKYEKEIQEFKQREIYDRIHREEAQQNHFHQLFWSVDLLRNPQYLYLSSKGMKAIEKQRQGHTEKKEDQAAA